MILYPGAMPAWRHGDNTKKQHAAAGSWSVSRAGAHDRGSQGVRAAVSRHHSVLGFLRDFLP